MIKLKRVLFVFAFVSQVNCFGFFLVSDLGALAQAISNFVAQTAHFVKVVEQMKDLIDYLPLDLIKGAISSGGLKKGDQKLPELEYEISKKAGEMLKIKRTGLSVTLSSRDSEIYQREKYFEDMKDFLKKEVAKDKRKIDRSQSYNDDLVKVLKQTRRTKNPVQATKKLSEAVVLQSKILVDMKKDGLDHKRFLEELALRETQKDLYSESREVLDNMKDGRSPYGKGKNWSNKIYKW